MARSPIPVSQQEWPEYEYRPFPKQIGLDANGDAITVNSKEEAEERAGEVVYPKTLGNDKEGKTLVATDPSQEVWMSRLVVKPKEDAKPDPVAAENARKAAEYDKLMAAKTPDPKKQKAA